MFELTNDQKKCFALEPIREHWECIEAKPSPYDEYKTYLYIDGNTVVKCILTGDLQYCEYELCEKVSPDKKHLLPKTAKGKPTILSSSTIQKRKGVGMRLNYYEETIRLYNEKTQCSYYSNRYLKDDICDLHGFMQWVEIWCKETTDTDIVDVIQFSQQERKHVGYQEGDVFRFKIGRRFYGYGRILLDYGKMRKQKIPFWDILMTKPLVCSVYHIVTERDDICVNELKNLRSLPSTIITDNSLYYGEYCIIGNLPVTTNEDYPIMYGESLSIGDHAICYQCGKVFRRIEDGTELYKRFTNHAVSFCLNFTLDVLLRCIEEQSNEPYWSLDYPYKSDRDLRDPKHADKLTRIRKQFDLL